MRPPPIRPRRRIRVAAANDNRDAGNGGLALLQKIWTAEKGLLPTSIPVSPVEFEATA